MVKRDFDVVVKDDSGKEVKFKGKNCTVNNKSIWTHLGLTKKVKETISCEDVEFKEEDD